jgi:hypothetical protein
MKSRGLRVLCYGHDDMLLFTREKILESHFSTQTCGSLARLGEMLVKGPVHLVVVCQSVPDWECDAVIDLSRAAWPEVKILALHEGVQGECTVHSDTTMENLEGPPALLHKVHTALGMASAGNVALG